MTKKRGDASASGKAHTEAGRQASKRQHDRKALEQTIPDWRKTGANALQLRFAISYLTNGFNGAEAYRQAYPGTKLQHSAIEGGTKMLREAPVQALLDLYTTDWLASKRSELEQEIIKTLWAMAFYDPSKFFLPNGKLAFESWDEIPVEMRRCVEGIEVKYYGKECERETITINMCKRMDALKSLSAYLSLMKSGVQQAGPGRGMQVSPDTELLLSSIFSQGRCPDHPKVAGQAIKAASAESSVSAAG